MALAIGVLLWGGCASNKPCPIIPAQLELGEERAQISRDELKQVSEEVERLQGNLERLDKNIAKLDAEKAILLELVGESGDEGEAEE
jgi:hypothetical protein